MDLLKKIYWRIFGNNFVYDLKKELKGCQTVLDLGCGLNSPIKYCKVSYAVGVEAFEPYLEKSKKKNIHNFYIKKNVGEVEFQEKLFDAVIALDVIEHFNKDDSLKLLKKMDGWAKKKIIISTPNGFTKQDESIDGNSLQRHLSGWDLLELKNMGFSRFFGTGGLKVLKDGNGNIKYAPKFFWKIIYDLTRRKARNNPEKAYGIFAIKDL